MNKMDKKEKIIISTIEFLKKGINASNIKIKDIASSADIGKGTVYEYFSSKEDILTQSLIYIIDKLIFISENMYCQGSFKEIFMTNISMYNELVIDYKSIIAMFLFDVKALQLSDEKLNEINRKLMMLKILITKKFEDNMKVAIEEKIVSSFPNQEAVEFAIVSIAVAVFRFNSVGGENIWSSNNQSDFSDYAEFLYDKFLKIIEN